MSDSNIYYVWNETRRYSKEIDYPVGVDYRWSKIILWSVNTWERTWKRLSGRKASSLGGKERGKWEWAVYVQERTPVWLAQLLLVKGWQKWGQTDGQDPCCSHSLVGFNKEILIIYLKRIKKPIEDTTWKNLVTFIYKGSYYMRAREAHWEQPRVCYNRVGDDKSLC